MAASVTVTVQQTWEKHGFLRTTLINHTVVNDYRLGISLDSLGRLYSGSREA